MVVQFYITRNAGYEKGFEHTFERDAALQVAKQLWKKYRNSAGANDYALVANPQEPHADLLIITTNGIGVLDLKNFSGEIAGKDDTEWHLLDENGQPLTQVKAGSQHLNPLEQVRKYKGEVHRKLKSLAREHPEQLPSWMNDSNVKFYVQGAVVFTGGQVDTSKLDLKPEVTQPWFKILQLHEVCDWAYSLVFGNNRYKDLRLSPEQIDFVARYGFQVDEWVEVHDFLDDVDPYGYLWVIQNGKRSWQHVLTDTETSIGRAADNTIHIAANPFAHVSRHHAVIRRIGAEVRIFDQDSRHGTWINGNRVTELHGGLLKTGDVIVLGAMNDGHLVEGACQFEYRSAAKEVGRTASIDALLNTHQDSTVTLDQLNSALSQSYAERYKQTHGIYPGQYVHVNVDPSSGKIVTYVGYLVVEEVHNPEREILLAEARKVNPHTTIGNIELIPTDWIPDVQVLQSIMEEASHSVMLQSASGNVEAGTFISSMLGGQLLDGKYYLHPDEFKSGGFGHVYRASQRNMSNRPVAIKVLKHGRVAQELYEEAQKSANIEHPNIVRLYDINTTNDGITYLAMEWIDGLTLLQWRSESLNYDADFLTLVQIARDICEGLVCIHEHGVVHGDISPKNVILAKQKEVWLPKLTDFGLAWALTEGKPERHGGTPLYIAPEVFVGKPDHRADIYSLGAVLFYLFTGTHHLGDLNILKQQPLQILRERILNQQPLRISDLQNGVFNPRLDKLIFEMLSVDPSQRPENVETIIHELDEVLSYSPAPQNEAVDALVSYYVHPSRLRRMVDGLGRENSTWLREKLHNIPEFYFEDTQRAPEVFEAIFGGDETYDVFIYNNGNGKHGYLEIKMVFAFHTNNPANLRFIQALGKVPILYAEIKPDRNNIFISDLSLVSAEKANNNYSNSIFTKLTLTRYSGKYPVSLWQHIEQLSSDPLPDPDTEERLRHWQGYLNIWERLAQEKEYDVTYTSWRFDINHDAVWFSLEGVDNETWTKIKKSDGEQVELVELRDLETSLYEVGRFGNPSEDYDSYVQTRLGTIERIISKRQRVLVKLDEYFVKKRWDKDKNLPVIALSGRLNYTATGDRHNIKQQRQALESLKIGQTVNPRLNRFIFDAQEAAVPHEKDIVLLDNKQLLSKNLNPDQRRAVEHALAAPDLYLIQGPPGTGKTTVIAELCHQFTLLGQRVLVASQANLAVDNALARLRHSPQILALRMGNINSIEDEGAEFIEDNIVRRWFENTLDDHLNSQNSFDQQVDFFRFIATNRRGLERYIEQLETNQPVLESLQARALELLEVQTNIQQELQQEQTVHQHVLSVQAHIADAMQNWQDMPVTHYLWRSQYFDFAMVDDTFSSYLDTILAAEIILQWYVPQFIEDAVRQHLSVLERDMLNQRKMGDKQAHTQVESPIPLLRLGNTMSNELRSVADVAAEWEMLVAQITDVQEGLKNFAYVQTLQGMPEHLESAAQLVDGAFQLYDTQLRIHDLEEERFAHEDLVSSHKKHVAQLIQKLAEIDHKRNVIEHKQYEVSKLIIDLDQCYDAVQRLQINYKTLQSDMQYEQERLEDDGILIASCEKVVASPQNYIAIHDRQAHINTVGLHKKLGEIYGNRVLNAQSESVTVFVATSGAMIQKGRKMAPNARRLPLDPKALDKVKRHWWQILKPMLLIEEMPERKVYKFKNPQQASKLILSELSEMREGHAEYEALRSIVKFFKDQVEQLQQLEAANELREEVHKTLSIWREQHQKKLTEMDNRMEQKKQVLQEIGVYKDQFAFLAKEVDSCLNELPEAWRGTAGIENFDLWPQNKVLLERIQSSSFPKANNTWNRTIQKLEVLLDKLQREQKQAEELMEEHKQRIKLLVQERIKLRKQMKQQLNESYTTFKGQSVLLRLFDAVSAFYQLYGDDVSFNDIRDAWKTIEQSQNALRDTTDNYYNMIGDQLFEEYLRVEEQKCEASIAELWRVLQPFVAITQLQLETSCLEQWKTFALEHYKTRQAIPSLMKALQPETPLSVWHRRVEAESIELKERLNRLEQQLNEVAVEVEMNKVKTQQLEKELADWDIMWANSFHSIPPYLRKDLPERNKFSSHSDYVRAVVQVADASDWSFEAERLTRQVPDVRTLLLAWQDRLRNPEVGDEQSILDLYLNNANVIGTSCGQVRRLDRNDVISSRFDVAIIDEVSKATPPELLMPMIRARKIILLGDHKQLPPMIGPDNTLREIAEDLNLPEDHLAHLQEPLFKHHYNSAPNDLKIMLREQYRMPALIRDAITSFYDGKLTGGHDRKHGLEMPGLFGSETVFSWIDMPRDDEHSEIPEGTSYRNDGEVKIITTLLKRMNEAWQQKLDKGTASEPKQVGLITFYMPQYRALNELAQTGRYPALELRVGTVDRFQGMERPVIIVSTVRNNAHGSIGFAKAPERINVAFSRAQELLVVVGCQQMFTHAKGHDAVSESARANYQRIANLIQQQPGGRRIRVPEQFNYA